MNDEKSDEQVHIAENVATSSSDEQTQGNVAVQTAIPENNVCPPNVGDAQAFAEQTAETEKQIAQQQEQDQKLLAALDEVLEKQNLQNVRDSSTANRSKVGRLTETVEKKGVGFVSLGLILVFMGIVMIVTLSASEPNYTIPLKLSPICAVLIGAEMLITYLLTHGRPRINIPSLVIAVLLVTGCCVLCSKLGGDYKEEITEHNNRTVAGEIYDKSYNELRNLADITSLKVDVDLNTDSDGKKKGMQAISAGDVVNISIELGGVYNAPENFAADCKKIIDGYRLMGINITNYHFKNESKFRSYALDVEGKYAQDFDISRLEDAVNYVYIDDYDYIEDMDDFIEATSETTSATVSD